MAFWGEEIRAKPVAAMHCRNMRCVLYRVAPGALPPQPLFHPGLKRSPLTSTPITSPWFNAVRAEALGENQPPHFKTPQNAAAPQREPEPIRPIAMLPTKLAVTPAGMGPGHALTGAHCCAMHPGLTDAASECAIWPPLR